MPSDVPTMPIEFSVAAFRLGHSMVRGAYNWNHVFDDGGGSLDLLFEFSATGGDLGGGPHAAEQLDRRLPPPLRLHARPAATTSADRRRRQAQLARRIDTRLVDPLRRPARRRRSAARDPERRSAHNLAFRNLTRARMVRLATGQQMAALMRSQGRDGDHAHAAQIRDGNSGAELGRRSPPRSAQRAARRHAALVLHPPRGRAQRRAAAPASAAASSPRPSTARWRAARSRSCATHLATHARPGHQHLPDGGPAPVRVRGQGRAAQPARRRMTGRGTRCPT